jgi:hypothetical protein
VGILLWEKRSSLLPVPLAVYAALEIACFIAEQVGVGGTAAFYDRYMIQLAPFLGVVAFALLPRLTPARVIPLAALSVVSHAMLWRNMVGH